jgi:putative N6-adenine-specific DNA methylase
MENNFKMVAKTFFGFEEIWELQMLGAQDVEQGVRMVSFKGIKDLCTKLICHCVPL